VRQQVLEARLERRRPGVRQQVLEARLEQRRPEAARDRVPLAADSWELFGELSAPHQRKPVPHFDPGLVDPDPICLVDLLEAALVVEDLTWFRRLAETGAARTDVSVYR